VYVAERPHLVAGFMLLPAESKYFMLVNTKLTNKQLGGIAFSILIVLGVIWLWHGTGSFLASSVSPQSQQASQAPKDESTMADIQSQVFVKQYLKSPGSAKFPFADAQVSRSKTNDNLYYVVSYVDSQNGFGALLRSNWASQILYIGGEDGDINSWELQQLIIDGQLVYDNTKADQTTSAKANK
jgi:hypothetical protein